MELTLIGIVISSVIIRMFYKKEDRRWYDYIGVAVISVILYLIFKHE